MISRWTATLRMPFKVPASHLQSYLSSLWWCQLCCSCYWGYARHHYDLGSFFWTVGSCLWCPNIGSCLWCQPNFEKKKKKLFCLWCQHWESTVGRCFVFLLFTDGRTPLQVVSAFCDFGIRDFYWYTRWSSTWKFLDM